MKRSQKLLASAIIIGIIIYFIFQTLSKSGVFIDIIPMGDYLENTINTSPGVEDITIDQETNIAYLSAHDRRNPSSTGFLYALNLNDPTNNIIDLTSKFKLKEFRPHGISFLKLQSGRKFLFVISHAEKKHDILKFEILGDSIAMLNKYSSSEFVSPNDVLGISENQFFITNDHSSRDKWKVMFSDFLRIPTGNVVFYDGEKARIASEKIAYANGIALSKSGEKIFVASTLDKKIYVYEPQAQDHQLKWINEFETKFPPDNIELAQDGKLIVGCHPKLLKFMSHKKSDSNLSPSAVIEIDENNPKSQETLYLNDGKSLSGSSVAAPFYFQDKKQNLILGSVFQSKILKLTKK